MSDLRTKRCEGEVANSRGILIRHARQRVVSDECAETVREQKLRLMGFYRVEQLRAEIRPELIVVRPFADHAGGPFERVAEAALRPECASTKQISDPVPDAGRTELYDRGSQHRRR